VKNDVSRETLGEVWNMKKREWESYISKKWKRWKKAKKEKKEEKEEKG
jgi:hypothetical protein